ncbi:hypothetical protein AB0D49_11660 [Streptomyces sp. NPDC048290]|uniref:hypothetical protein n=1 Tax=Streptomyces sp. NPDC048290 TaxID=3155811 RepID=UPI00343C1A3E
MSGTGRGRRIAAVTGAVLVAGAVLAGVGATVLTVRDADRDAGAPRWRFPEATEERAGEPEPDGLAGMLVPYGADGGWYRGPDIAHYGHDAELSGAQAMALRKESLRSLPRALREDLEAAIDRQGSEGIALRSYASSHPGFYAVDEDAFTATVVLERRADRAAVQRASREQRDLFEALSAEAGPKIKGHPDAGCFVLPEGEDGEAGEGGAAQAAGIIGVYCSAAVGDVLVTVVAHGAEDFYQDTLAGFVRVQLDRITDPGKAI